MFLISPRAPCATSGTFKRRLSPLDSAVEITNRLAEGDLTVRIENTKNDEIGQVNSAIGVMVGKLRNIVGEVKAASDSVASGATQISATSLQLSEGAQTQASTLEETSAAVEELSASIDQVTDHAQSQTAAVEQSASNMDQVRESTELLSETLEEVSHTANEAVEKAHEGAESVKEVVGAINSISESSERIAGIVNVISEIADQTNLLALNASIEAARAGEHGRGFAVVADEVSKLADRSTASAKEIVGLIKESEQIVATGVETAEKVGYSMQGIMEGSRSSSKKVDDLNDGGLFLAVDYFNAFDLVICGAGYNAFWEAVYFKKEAIFVPAPRRFEDQKKRVHECQEHYFDTNGADQLVDIVLNL